MAETPGTARWIAIALAAAAAAGLGACNILAPAAFLIGGQPKEPAKYELLDARTVVFVDDRNNAIPVSSSRVRASIAEQITNDIITQKLVDPTNMINARDAMALTRARDREGALLSMQAIADAVGAQQIVYVEMLSFRGSPDNQEPRPVAACRVKVIDAVSRTRVFPAPESVAGWEDVAVMGRPVSPELYRSNQGRREIEQMLSALVADRVAKLFYKHIPDELGSRLDGQ